MNFKPDTAFFKIKPTKRSNPEDRTTLDVLHQYQLQRMKQEDESVEQLIARTEGLKKQIDTTNDDILRGQLENKYIRLQEELCKKQKKDRVYDYFLDTGDTLFKYYDIQELIAKGEDNSIVESSRRKPGNILTALESAVELDNKEAIASAPTTAQEGTKKHGKKREEKALSRDSLLEEYLRKIDPSYNKKHVDFTDVSDECDVCGEDMIFSQNEASLYCTGCGCVEFILIDSDRPSYKDPPRESSYYAYKRINHFNELLAQFQAKETKEIPEETFQLIVLELKKQRITDMSTIKYQFLRQILRKLKLNSLYDRIPHIQNRLNGHNTPVMDRETEERLRHLFKEIQPSFQKHCPKNRRNFLSYAYVLYKFCELLELDDFLANFPLLKNRDKLYQQSKVWQKICEDMKWEYIAGV